MFENLLGSLGDIAGKLGLPEDQIASLTESVTGKLGAGGDQMTALMEAAQEHGLPVEKLQELLGGAGGVEGLLGKVGGMLGGEGGASPLDSLGDMAKGLFK
jgi:hypothetical protein